MGCGRELARGKGSFATRTFQIQTLQQGTFSEHSGGRKNVAMVCAYQRPVVQPSFKTPPLFKNFLCYKVRTAVLAYHMATVKTSVSFSVNGLAILTNK